MRLLQFHGTRLRLKEFTGRPPPYAILSHTWLADEREEPSQAQVQQLISTGMTTTEIEAIACAQPGFSKIIHFIRKAEADGFQYFWADTCCINDAERHERSHAVGSMFKWYTEAGRCYVYLADTATEAQLGSSRYWRRGWTLQEFLGPSDVVFYSQTWHRIGDKTTLSDTLSQCTGIHKQALIGRNALMYFDLNSTLHWMTGRETKREQDKVYCLLGILDVRMPVDYGETLQSAGHRCLIELQKKSQDLAPVDAFRCCMDDAIHMERYVDARQQYSQARATTAASAKL